MTNLQERGHLLTEMVNPNSLNLSAKFSGLGRTV